MTETTEQAIARLSQERAKIILENSDYWSGPGSAKTSAEAVTALVALGNTLATIAKANAVAETTPTIEDAVKVAKELLREVGELPGENPAAPATPKRGPKAKDQTATPETNGEPESADA